MPSLLNGLSAMGEGIAKYAGAVGLEAQKAELANQSAILADQLATTRETALQGQRHAFQAGLQQSSQVFQSGENTRAQAAEMAREQARLASAAQLQQNQLNAPSPEIKSAQQFAKLSPAEKQAYREEMMTKAGLPPWMSGGDAASAQPTGSGAISPPASDTSLSPGAPDMATPGSARHNDKALENVPPSAASIIKGMVDGRISPPSSFAAAKPYWQAMIAKAAEYDPTFDETTWSGRVATRKDFSSGQAAKGVTALNTALAHAGTLVGDFDALNNFSFTPANMVFNYIAPKFGDARQNKAEQTVNALASEARKVFAASGGGNLTELQEWQKSFPLNGSPDQQRAALRGFVELLDGRLQALSDQYNRGMGRTDDPVNLLQPKARAVYEKLTGHEPENSIGYQLGRPPAAAESTAATQPTATSAPAVLALPKTEAELVVGKTYDTARGQARWDGKLFIPVH